MRCAKRVLDIIVASALLILALPVELLAALIIWLSMGSPVIFRQVRPGRDQEPYTLLKFRTMRSASGSHETDGDRLTAIGKVLRRTSIDELPQLVNVLRGEMSLVGPRPLLVRYLPYFTAEERRRFDVQPGITGWAQIHGRNRLDWNERLALDVWYVNHWSFVLDLHILLETAQAVIRRRDVVVDANVELQDLDVLRREAGRGR
jgi:lipopolysaccharide/colanic/teichoic acid biosynthesis glycosyltransferase